MYGYAYALYEEQTITPFCFSSEDSVEVYLYSRCLLVLKDYQFFNQTIVFLFSKLFNKGFALVYRDNTFLFVLSKTPMLERFEQLHQIYSSNDLESRLLLENLFLSRLRFIGFAIHWINDFLLQIKKQTPFFKSTLLYTPPL